jgi:Ni,Fe-hydrogenase III component G
MMDNETILQTARLLAEDIAESMDTPAPNRLDIRLNRAEHLMPIVAGLRVKRLGYLAAIVGLDPGGEQDNLEVLYFFCPGAAIVTLRLLVPKSEAQVPTLSEIIPSAEPFERELSEMFGIKIVGIHNPTHLYLPDDWEEGIYPLRKDVEVQAFKAQT